MSFITAIFSAQEKIVTGTATTTAAIVPTVKSTAFRDAYALATVAHFLLTAALTADSAAPVIATFLSLAVFSSMTANLGVTHFPHPADRTFGKRRPLAG